MALSRDVSDGPRLRSHAARQATPHRWQLAGLLGVGQWTEVYQARPSETDSDGPADYAIKLIRADVDAEVALRLLTREAEVAADVGHEHLVTVLGDHVRESPPFLVLPRLEGNTLESLLGDRRRIHAPLACWIARQVCEALEALHARGWVHGDVKPANIFVAESGHATLSDLGLARRVGTGECRASTWLAGTPAYGAPEIWNSAGEYGPASDNYSLGVTLFRMLTGRLPFLASDPGALALAHLRETPPDPRSLEPNLPPRACSLVRQLLAKEPLRRLETSELVRRLVELELDLYEERVPGLEFTAAV